MMRSVILAATFLFFSAGQNIATAASLEWGMRITCRVDDTRSLTNQDQYRGDRKAVQIQSYFSSWIFNDDNYPKEATIEFDWTPWTPNGSSLKIIDSNSVHNSIRLLSRTKDSLIVSTSASDSMTAESWLFTLNFRQEAVIATQIQTNVGGVKGKVLIYACDFNHKNRSIKVREPKESVG